MSMGSGGITPCILCLGTRYRCQIHVIIALPPGNQRFFNGVWCKASLQIMRNIIWEIKLPQRSPFGNKVPQKCNVILL